MRSKPRASTATLLATVLLFALPGFAAEATSTGRAIPVSRALAGVPVIEVSGNAEVKASPDTAYLSLSVETHAPTAQAASSQNAALAHKVVNALQTKLAGKGRISTGGYSLSPEYSAGPTKPGQRPEIVGYVARNSIMVETGELNILGALIDSAIAAGANQVNYLNFGLHDDRKARIEAITQASKDAQTEANTLAASLGVRLGKVLKASVGPEFGPVPLRRVFALESGTTASAPTPVKPGQITVRATVSLTYEIQ